jgi:hypothetical protein
LSMTARVPVHQRTTCVPPMPTGALDQWGVWVGADKSILLEVGTSTGRQLTSGPLQKFQERAPAVHHSC